MNFFHFSSIIIIFAYQTKKNLAMETVKTTYLGNLRTQATHMKSGATVFTYSPENNQSKSDAFSPTDLFAASYASCALTIIGISAQSKGFNIEGAIVKTTKVMGDNPRRIVELKVDFTFPANNYSDRERKIIERSINQCPVSNSFPEELKITRTINYL
jgi:uncharacterized OsmC-like protein